MPTQLVGGRLRLRYASADPGVDGVTLEVDPSLPGGRELTRDADGWVLDLPVPPLLRVEYRFLVRRGAAVETVLDPGSDSVVATAFGDRSVCLLPGYRVPDWLAADAPAGTRVDLEVDGETADAVPVSVWSPEGLADGVAAPLLVVHDGPEYDDLADLTRYCAAMVDAGALPPFRVALAAPVMRDAWYSGSPAYLRTVAQAGLDRMASRFPVNAPIVVMGASLGGLTALLLGLTAAPRVGGVFAQSGSFFQVRHDDSESGFRYFGRISRLVQAVLDAREVDHPLVVGMTCGATEENAANNRDMAAALRRAGHEVSYREVADLHNYTAWRDALDPTLTEILARLWAPVLARD